MNVAVIPARAGSKRIPRKNIRTICGKPAIELTIRELIQSGVFEKVFVSTDDDEIASISEKQGAQIIYRCGPQLAGDTAPTSIVMSHALTWIESKSIDPEFVACVYPLSVLLTKSHYQRLFDVWKTSQLPQDSYLVFSALEYAHPIQRSFTIEGSIAHWTSTDLLTLRTQECTSHFHDAGQFYGASKNFFKNFDRWFESRSIPIILNRDEAIDVDTIADWSMLEALYVSKNRSHLC